MFYEKYNRNDESIIHFLTQERVYSGEDIKGAEFKGQVFFLNQIKQKIYLCLFIYWLMLVLDYIIDPEHHFITTIKKRFKHGG